MTEPNAGPRIGWCCLYVPPDGNAETARRMNPGTVTIATLSRLDGPQAVEKLMSVLGRNLDALHRQLDEVGRHPSHRRLLRLSSGLLPAYTHPIGRGLYAEPSVRALVEAGLEQAGHRARGAGIRIGLHPDQF